MENFDGRAYRFDLYSKAKKIIKIKTCLEDMSKLNLNYIKVFEGRIESVPFILIPKEESEELLFNVFKFNKSGMELISITVTTVDKIKELKDSFKNNFLTIKEIGDKLFLSNLN